MNKKIEKDLYEKLSKKEKRKLAYYYISNYLIVEYDSFHANCFYCKQYAEIFNKCNNHNICPKCLENLKEKEKENEK